MKFIKLKKETLPSLVLGMCSLVTFSAFAGGISDGGGNAVVCRNRSGQITSAEMLDLYEGRVQEGLTYDQGAGESLMSRVQRATDKFQNAVEPKQRELFYNSIPYWFYRDGVYLGQKSVPTYAKNFDRFFRILPDDVTLPPLDDSHEIVVPVGCAVERLALYQGNKIYLVGPIWRAMNVTNKAGLIFHEAAYKYDRDLNNAQDSRVARRTVMRFMANEPVPSVTEDVPISAAHCRWMNDSSAMNARTWTEFFIFKGNNNNYQVRFVSLLGQRMYGLTGISSPAHERNGPVGEPVGQWLDLPALKLTRTIFGPENNGKTIGPHLLLESLGGGGWNPIGLHILPRGFSANLNNLFPDNYPVTCDKEIE